MAHSNDEIRGVWVQSGDDRLLLPNATIAEVLSRAPIMPIEGAPAQRFQHHDLVVGLRRFAAQSGQPRDGLLADATEEELPAGVQVRVLLGDEVAILPDLQLVEDRIHEALQAA